MVTTAQQQQQQQQHKQQQLPHRLPGIAINIAINQNVRFMCSTNCKKLNLSTVFFLFPLYSTPSPSCSSPLRLVSSSSFFGALSVRNCRRLLDCLVYLGVFASVCECVYLCGSVCICV